jgi:ribosomal protein L7/L12
VSNERQLLELMARVGALEHQLAHLYRHLGIEMPPAPAPGEDISETVQQLVRDGNLIGAIKQYRSETGTSLADAKERIETLASSR